MSSGLFYYNPLNRSISNSRVSGKFLLSLCFIEIPELNANCVDPNQMLWSAASDLGLHCLQVTLLGVSRLKLVNEKCYGIHLNSLSEVIPKITRTCNKSFQGAHQGIPVSTQDFVVK